MKAFYNTNQLTVCDLTYKIKETLEGSFADIQVVGEVSNFRPSSIGHWYFTLKDKDASLAVVMFKVNTWRVQRPLKDGDKIVVMGNLDVYPPRGSYQLKATNIEFVGIGNILAQLEQRKRAYASAGWFDAKYKKNICKIPKKLGIVTSPTTAALQDVLQVLGRRAPSLDVIVIPAVVQGADSSKTIADAIDLANQYLLCDQLIVTRGGGSIEDLLPFSEDSVLRSILKSNIPIISGVGHEIDWALSDFVADLRAPTPSAAAELASEGIFEAREKNKELKNHIISAINNHFTYLNEKRSRFDKTILASLVENKIDSIQFRLANCENDIERSIDSKVENITYKKLSIEKDISSLILNNYSLAKYKFDSLENTIARSVDVRIDSMYLKISNFKKEIKNLLSNKIDLTYYKSKDLRKELTRNIENQVNNTYIDMKNNKKEINLNLKSKIDDFISLYNVTNTELKALSPKSVLNRGYSITRNTKGQIISSIEEVKKNDSLIIDLKNGSINVKAE